LEIKTNHNKQKKKTQEKKPGFTLFFIEKLGFFFILVSGLMPFVHSFVKREILVEKFFGYPSIQAFLYSLGVHLCILFLTIGILMTISIANSAHRYRIIQNYLRYSLISPFVSGVFYITWVFVPDVDYNILAYIFLALIISIISIIILYRIYRYINVLKLDYNNQLTQIKDSISNIKINLTKTKLSDDIVNDILHKLKEFESSEEFTKRNLSLNSLALYLKTNSKYLSTVINQHKKKNFTQYINDLRIEYLITILKTDKTYSNYTISAVAKEIGFKTPNAFSRAFYNKTGEYPSKHIKEITYYKTNN
jgi:AraC-like DNA-binding protein